MTPSARARRAVEAWRKVPAKRRGDVLAFIAPRCDCSGCRVRHPAMRIAAELLKAAARKSARVAKGPAFKKKRRPRNDDFETAERGELYRPPPARVAKTKTRKT